MQRASNAIVRHRYSQVGEPPTPVKKRVKAEAAAMRKSARTA